MIAYSRAAHVATSEQLLERFLALQAFLHKHEQWWRNSPFHQESPDWAVREPELHASLLELSDESVDILSRSSEAAVDWLKRWLPALELVPRLCEVPNCPPPEPGPERFFAHVPGGKRAQVEAFASAVGDGCGGEAWLEWCAGKGHLGRWLGQASAREVLSLEWDEELCETGRALAARSRLRQQFRCLDVLAPEAKDTLPHRHVVALHACGELHRRLVEHVGDISVPALDFSPCCYDLIPDETYRNFVPEATLGLDRVALRLAVTDMGCNRRRGERRRRELAWKLAYKQVREEWTGVTTSTPLASTPNAWAYLSFPEWCQTMAARDGLSFPEDTDWEQLEDVGHQLRVRFERLNIPRLVFRRPLETWLVMDMALYLSRKGHDVTVSTFCDGALTPRNFMVSARFRG
ncbi:MAG: SAM-dependent methyltransferase [Myxococcales bacterium]|nr:SAM-dependent methyltransferase [Myxococcales bacterium]